MAERAVTFFEVFGAAVVFAFFAAGSAAVVVALRFGAERVPRGAMVESIVVCQVKMMVEA